MDRRIRGRTESNCSLTVENCYQTCCFQFRPKFGRRHFGRKGPDMNIIQRSLLGSVVALASPALAVNLTFSADGPNGAARTSPHRSSSWKCLRFRKPPPGR
jgi:hypothetical protein